MSLALKRVLRWVPRQSVDPWPIERVVETCPSKRREEYRVAADHYRDFGVTSKDARVSMFVKADKFSDIEAPGLKKPRPIQARSVVFNVAYGRYIKPIYEMLVPWKGVARSVNRTRVFTSGLSPRQKAGLIISKVRGFRRCRILELDVSTFDACVKPFHLRLVHALYRHIIGPSEELDRLMEMTLRSKGRTAHGIKYKVVGNRMSGDMDTSLGNSVILFLALLSFASFDVCLTKWDCVVDGDNALLFIEDGVLLSPSKLSSSFAAMGFKVKCDDDYVPESYSDIVFNRSRLMKVRGKWSLVRNIGRAVTTFGVTHQYWTSMEVYARYLKGTALCELVVSEGVPIIGPLAYAFARLNVKPLISSDDLYKSGYKIRVDDLSVDKFSPRVDPETRVEVARVFGITVEEQLAFEAEIPNFVAGLERGFQPANYVWVSGRHYWWTNPDCT